MTSLSNIFYSYFDSPVGVVEVCASQSAIQSIFFVEDKKSGVTGNSITQRAVEQLADYFSGQRTNFDLPLDAKGTAFQKSVWQALCDIPHGQTCSYGDIANKLGNPKAVRAVGAANGKNPISIVVPCHRVIGANGTLTGYAGGLTRKSFLLELENPSAQEELL